MNPLVAGLAAAALASVAVPALTTTPGGSTSPPAQTPPAQTPPAQSRSTSVLPRGPAGWPVPPTVIVTEFDDPLPYAAGHRGIDLAASVGQTVVASASGQVTVAGPVAGRSVVVIQHADDLRTTYLPVVPLVRPGERVVAGDPIGTLAPSGHCRATPCLHWGARHGDLYIDPRSLLGAGAGPVVLLPDE